MKNLRGILMHCFFQHFYFDLASTSNMSSSSFSNYNLFFIFLCSTISAQWSLSAICSYIDLCCSFYISSFVILTDFPLPYNFLRTPVSPFLDAMSLVIVFKAFYFSFFFGVAMFYFEYCVESSVG